MHARDSEKEKVEVCKSRDSFRSSIRLPSPGRGHVSPPGQLGVYIYSRYRVPRQPNCPPALSFYKWSTFMLYISSARPTKASPWPGGSLFLFMALRGTLYYRL
jgi:hypothetical protein